MNSIVPEDHFHYQEDLSRQTRSPRNRPTHTCYGGSIGYEQPIHTKNNPRNKISGE